MEQRQALIEALDLIKVMGSIIRTLDTENSHCEYWLNDGNENGGDYVPAAIEIAKGLDEQDAAIDKSHDDPIKCAFTSNSCEGRTIIVYSDGGVKIFDQGDNWDQNAFVTNIEPDDVQTKLTLLADVDDEEVFEIQQALQAP